MRGRSASHPGGVRAGVWVLAVACLLAAFAIVAGITRRDAHERAAVAETPRKGAIPVVSDPARAVAIEAARVAADSPTLEPIAAHESGATEPSRVLTSTPTSDVAMERADAPRDSHIAAEIRVLESEAARVAEDLELLPSGHAERAPDRAAEDARVRRLADALLVEHFVQDAYRGTEFPLDYPAEERTRAAAESQVRGLTPEMRRDLLEVVLQQDALAERVAPQFAPPESGLIWENAAR